MKLIAATDDHLRRMMGWFPDHRSCVMWGGPDFRFPFAEETFIADVRSHALPSFALTGEAGQLLGFDQYYLRAGRCHLSRLVIAPSHRGRGLGVQLIAMLIENGITKLQVDECSLFVMTGNLRAMRLYERLGFSRAAYPEPGREIPDSYYMIASAESLAKREIDACPGR